MAKIGRETVKVGNREFSIEVKFDLNVNAAGEFTATLDEKDVKMIQGYGIELYNNGRFNSRLGFFCHVTKIGLIEQITEVLRKCVNREEISREIVIRYSFQTVGGCAFTTEGKIIPNPGWTRDGEVDKDLYWQHGTFENYSSSARATGIQFYAQPFMKITYKYGNGQTKVEYLEITERHNFENGEYYLNWLAAIKSTKPPENGKGGEIAYTEERAKFFVDLFKSVVNLSFKIKELVDADTLIGVIENGNYLLPKFSYVDEKYRGH